MSKPLIAFALLLGCEAKVGQRDPLPSPTTASAEPRPSSSPALPTADLSVEIVGTWEAPACGARAYPRTVTFEKAGTFAARDLVSPCPAGTVCVWSGIVERSGTYQIDGSRVRLTVTSGDVKMGAPFPAELVRDASDGLVEAAGDARCSYRRR